MSTLPNKELALDDKILYMGMLFEFMGLKFTKKAILVFILSYDELLIKKGELDLDTIAKIFAKADEIFPSENKEENQAPKETID